MKNAMKLWALLALLPMAVMAAQSNLDQEVNAELDKMYQGQGAASQGGSQQKGSAPQVQVNVQAQPLAAASQSNNQAATQGAEQKAAVQAIAAQEQTQAQKQPTTVIEASPLTESNAEKLRKSRQDAEVATEQGIVEKLEQSRLDDEKRRAEALFGDKFNQMQKQPEPAPAPAPVVVVPVPTPAPVVVEAAPAPVKEEKLDKEAIRGEVNAALADMKKEEPKKPGKFYVGAIAGMGDYPDAVNVKGQYALGFELGKKFEDHVAVEGTFMYSNYQIEQRFNPYIGSGGCDPYTGQCYPRITEMNQYSTGALVKYQFLDGMLRPELGAAMAYTYRTFSDKQFALSGDTVSSQALDMGLMTGVSIELSENFAIGLDFRYMWNLTNKVDDGFQRSFVQPALNQDKPIESLSYYTLGLVGRASF